MVPLEVSGESRAVVTVHLGFSEIRVGLVSLRGVTLHEVKVPYAGTEPQAVVETIRREVDRVVTAELGSLRLLGVGASIGGWVDADTGVVVHYAPLGWRDVPLAAMLAESLEWPLFFDQMVRGMALAEMMFGAARGTRDFVELYVGNIVGAAIVDEGILRRGPRGAAGSVAHLPVRNASGASCSCGRTDCLQSVASDVAILAQAKLDGFVPAEGDFFELAAMVRAGVSDATVLAAESARYLGEASAVIVDLVNPALLVLAGLQPQWPGFLESFTAAFSGAGEHDGNEVEVALSAFGEITPTVASAALFLDAYYRDPFAYEPTPAAASV